MQFEVAHFLRSLGILLVLRLLHRLSLCDDMMFSKVLVQEADIIFSLCITVSFERFQLESNLVARVLFIPN
jgi:hypothetical protein